LQWKLFSELYVYSEGIQTGKKCGDGQWVTQLTVATSSSKLLMIGTSYKSAPSASQPE